MEQLPLNRDYNMDAHKESPLMEALREFEATEANLVKLERLLQEIVNLIPNGIRFGSNPDYEDRCRAFRDVLASLPMIDDWKPDYCIPDLNELAQARLDAEDIGEVSLWVEAEESIEIPGKDLRTYRLDSIRKDALLFKTLFPS